MEGAVILLIIVAVVVFSVLVWTGWKRFPLRIGIGNFFRRKTQVAFVVAGLLIGTAIISSAFVIQSTFEYTIRSEVFKVLDHTDEVVVVLAPDGTRMSFNYSVYEDLEANLSNMPNVDGLAPRYHISAAVFDANTQLFEPINTVIGFEANNDLGEFVRLDGSKWNGDGLGPTDVIINQRLAGEIEAEVGHTLTVYLGASTPTPPMNMNVAEIVKDEGRGAYNGNTNVFVRLDVLQTALNQTGQINLMLVSNTGGVTEGYLRSDEAVSDLESYLPSTPAFTIDPVKADSIEQATEGMSMISQLFILLGSFTIIAGILLIINIFVMLAEERKGEMGVSRAVGMRRSNLVQSFVAEGMLYALLSAAVGALVGLVVAGAILWAFENIIPVELMGNIRFRLTWTNLDLMQAFAIGFIITMITIIGASWRVSKLNIVRAIRDIPEPRQRRSTRRQVAVGVALAVLGAIMTIGAYTLWSEVLQDLGPTTLVIGLAVIFMRVISPRVAFSAAGIFTIVWLLLPYKPIPVESAGIELFVLAGLLLVMGGLLIVMFNSDTLLAVATRIVRRRTWRPVIRTAISYPMNKKFRTGTTLASIALVMFTIATMLGIQSMVFTTIGVITERQTGGFDIVAYTNSLIPKPNFEAEFAASPVSQNISEHHGLSEARFRFTKNASLANGFVNSSIVGMPAEWTDVPFELYAIDPVYASPSEMWAAVQANDSLCVLDGTVVPQEFVGMFVSFQADIGDVIYYRNATGAAHSLTVVGILYEQFIQGVFVGWDTVSSNFRNPVTLAPINSPSIFFFKANPGLDTSKVAHDLERTFVHYQMLTFDFNTFIQQMLDIIMGVFNLLVAYLALGLVVGIAGLGVITMRNVVERKAETGALRALGFRKGMVLRSYLFELSFIALTGILMGDLLGVAVSYNLYLNFFAGQGVFVIPWDKLFIVSLVAFVIALITTASPAIRASRMPPAEALRTFE